MRVPEIDKDTGVKPDDGKEAYVPGRPYSKIHRELSEEDMMSPAVQKLLISEIDKLESRIKELEIIEREYHKVDKEKAILQEKSRVSIAIEVLSGFCLSVGSAILGLASLIHDTRKFYGSIVVGFLLIIGGILSKLIKKWS